jgi:hypothetical protein
MTGWRIFPLFLMTGRSGSLQFILYVKRRALFFHVLHRLSRAAQSTGDHSDGEGNQPIKESIGALELFGPGIHLD